MAENLTYRVEPDGFYGELVRPTEDKYPGKALICFSGSDGGIGLARMLAGVFAGRGLTALALAYERSALSHRGRQTYLHRPRQCFR